MKRAYTLLFICTTIVFAGCLGGPENATIGSNEGGGENTTVQQLGFDTVRSLQAVNGEEAYIAGNASGEHLIHGGEIIAAAAQITHVAYRDGKWAYAAKTNENNGEQDGWTVRFGEEQYGPYDAVSRITPISRSLAFSATANESTVLLYKGREVGLKYELRTPMPTEVNGKLAYVGHADEETIIIHDGDEVVRGTNIDAWITNLGGKVGYLRRPSDHSTSPVTVVRGTEVTPTGYQEVEDVVWHNGSLHYAVSNGSQSGTYVVHHQPGDRDGPYTSVKGLQVLGGKITYVATRNGETVIRYGDQRIASEEAVAPSKMAATNGTLAYTVESATGRQTVRYGETRIGPYDTVHGIAEINGTLTVLASDDDSTYLVKKQ